VVRGGVQNNQYQFRNGGAGTIYLKGPGALLGDLIADNRGVVGTDGAVPWAGTTSLPSLGIGVAQAGTAGATLVTDRAVNVPLYFAGHWVEIRDAGNVLKGRWRISTALNGIVAKTVILVPNGAETISMVQGDKWQGVYRFDNAPTVRNGASLTSTDPILLGGPLSVTPALESRPAEGPGDDRSSRTRPPRINRLSLCTSGTVLAPGASLTVCADVQGEGDITVDVTGAFRAHAIAEGGCATLTVPASARLDDAVVRVTLTDGAGRTATASSGVSIVADRRGPAVTRIYPADGAVLFAGETAKVGVEAWDDVSIAGATISVDGRTSVLASPPFEVELAAPGVISARVLPIVIDVFDAAGNVASRRFVLEVRPGARLFGFTGTSVPADTSQPIGLRLDGGWPFEADPETLPQFILPSVGQGTVAGASGSTVWGPGAWPAALQSTLVQIEREGEFVGRFRIMAVSADGASLTLEPAAAGRVLPGDSYQGVQIYPEIVLTGNAHVVTADILESPSISVDSSSTLRAANLLIPGAQKGDLRQCAAPETSPKGGR
jgi:hypothetical protein